MVDHKFDMRCNVKNVSLIQHIKIARKNTFQNKKKI